MTPYSCISFFLQVNPDINELAVFANLSGKYVKSRRAYVLRLSYLLFFAEQKKWIEKIILALHSDQGL